MKPKKTKQADLERLRGILFTISLVISLGVVLLAFEWKTEVEPVIVFDPLEGDMTEELYIPLTSREEKKEMPKIKQAVEFILTPDDDYVDTDLAYFDPGDDDEIFYDPSQFINPSNTDDPEEKFTEYIIVEEMPEFPGGEKALLTYLARSIKYPVIAQENGVFGKVFVTFIVNEFGKVVKVEIARGDDLSLNNEALRVVQSMPLWRPGKQGGKNVNVRFTVPINFVLK